MGHGAGNGGCGRTGSQAAGSWGSTGVGGMRKAARFRVSVFPSGTRRGFRPGGGSCGTTWDEPQLRVGRDRRVVAGGRRGLHRSRGAHGPGEELARVGWGPAASPAPPGPGLGCKEEAVELLGASTDPHAAGAWGLRGEHHAESPARPPEHRQGPGARQEAEGAGWELQGEAGSSPPCTTATGASPGVPALRDLGKG